MRLSTLFTLSALTLVSAQSQIEVEDRVRTTVAIDAPPTLQSLTSGQVQIHITRFDDLISSSSPSSLSSSSSPHRLLLSKQTHLILHVSLDMDSGLLDVNGQSIDLASASSEPKLTIVKAEALAIPSELIGQPKTVEELQKHLTGSLVSAQVGVRSEVVDGKAVSFRPLGNEEGEKVQVDMDDAQMRKISVDLKLLEIDSHSIPHSTTLHHTILQLLIAHHTPTGRILSIQNLPSVSPSSLPLAPPPPRPQSLLDNLRTYLGLPPRPPRRPGCNRHRPAALSDFSGEMPESVIGGAMAPHADVPFPPSEGFRDENGVTNLITHRVGLPGSRLRGGGPRLFHDHPGHGHGHGYGHVLGCALRVIVGVFIAVLLVPVLVLMNPVGALVAVAVFVLVRRARRERRRRLEEAEEERLEEGEGGEEGKGEKGGEGILEEVVVVDELPKYEERERN